MKTLLSTLLVSVLCCAVSAQTTERDGILVVFEGVPNNPVVLRGVHERVLAVKIREEADAVGIVDHCVVNYDVCGQAEIVIFSC